MKTLAITAAIIAAIATPSMLLAADAGTTASTVACRAAGASETSNATLSTTALICHKVDMEKMQAAIAKLRAMEDKMDDGMREQVEILERMLTEAATYS
jgi:hypothetical protein